MKKILLSLALALVLILLTATVVFADQPLNVGPAFIINNADTCGVYWPGDSMVFEGAGKYIYSNSATGHLTYKCKMELKFGDPYYDYWEFTINECVYTFSFEGERAMWTMQCFDRWYP